MACPPPIRYTPTDRAARVLTALARGCPLAQADVVRLTGLRPAYVYTFMCRLSLYAPIYLEDGRWYWCKDDEVTGN